MMLNSQPMTKELEFESEKNKKAFLYTAIICGILLLLFILISWKVMPPSIPIVQDLMEINLGNNDEGFGEKQPLIKGERSQVNRKRVEEYTLGIKTCFVMILLLTTC